MKKSKVILNLVHEVENESTGNKLKGISYNDPRLLMIRKMVGKSKGGGRTLFHKKIDKQIHDDWQHGRTIKSLCRDYGKSYKFIMTSIKREIRWENRTKKYRFSEAINESQLETIRFNYFDGLPIAQLAKMFKTSEYQVRKVIRNCGWHRPKRRPHSL